MKKNIFLILFLLITAYSLYSQMPTLSMTGEIKIVGNPPFQNLIITVKDNTNYYITNPDNYISFIGKKVKIEYENTDEKIKWGRGIKINKIEEVAFTRENSIIGILEAKPVNNTFVLYISNEKDSFYITASQYNNYRQYVMKYVNIDYEFTGNKINDIKEIKITSLNVLSSKEKYSLGKIRYIGNEPFKILIFETIEKKYSIKYQEKIMNLFEGSSPNVYFSETGRKELEYNDIIINKFNFLPDNKFLKKNITGKIYKVKDGNDTKYILKNMANTYILSDIAGLVSDKFISSTFTFTGNFVLGYPEIAIENLTVIKNAKTSSGVIKITQQGRVSEYFFETENEKYYIPNEFLPQLIGLVNQNIELSYTIEDNKYRQFNVISVIDYSK